MPKHRESRHVPYTVEQMFDLVADIERYPEFVPGYREARALSREAGRLRARQRVGIGVIGASFDSEAELDRPHHIRVRSHERPFHMLAIDWHFEREGAGCCVQCLAEFHLADGLAALALAPWTDLLAHRLTEAFVRRARALYGEEGKD
ncbi:MAG: type II toxin-antitoxin system RatA family toxin [Thiohalomonadaceae bacterium]